MRESEWPFPTNRPCSLVCLARAASFVHPPSMRASVPCGVLCLWVLTGHFLLAAVEPPVIPVGLDGTFWSFSHRAVTGPIPEWKRAGIWYLAGANTCVYSNPRDELGATQHNVQTSNRRFRDDEFIIPSEVARWCEGVDYLAMAPGFFRNRAVASMFETYPGIGIYNTRRPVPMGDGGGRVFGGDRDKVLSARRILVGQFRDDPMHQAVHSFNETTPRSGVGNYAYKDFLWRDPTVQPADLSRSRLSHISPGPGYVAARSSWDEDATYLFFKCGDRFTAHQHLDVGHFLIYKHEELAGDGGHYDAFGSAHDVNVHLRSIAHNTMLVHDPSETWPNIRAGQVTGNDGGQAHNWPHHNGAVADAAAWNQDRSLYDIADLVAFEDCEDYVYMAGDCTRAYSSKKLERFTRQILFLRPGTFIVFDQVVSTQPEFKKTWLLQAMKRPEKTSTGLMITNGKGRLFVQTLLPRDPQVVLYDGEDLYSYAGNSYLPQRDTGPAPECRIEISPSQSARSDSFLHVLTATDATVDDVLPSVLEETDREVRVQVGKTSIAFDKNRVTGVVEIDKQRRSFPERIMVLQGGRSANAASGTRSPEE